MEIFRVLMDQKRQVIIFPHPMVADKSPSEEIAELYEQLGQLFKQDAASIRNAAERNRQARDN